MSRHILPQLVVAFAAAGVFFSGWTGQVLAVETLRIGTDGNVAWDGTVFGRDIVTFPTEYKVGNQSSEVGNTPGNLIDLTNFDNIVPAALIKTVVDVAPELLEDQLDLVNQMLVDAVSPLGGVADIRASAQGNLSTVLIEFDRGLDLGEVTQQVSEALDPIRPEEAGSASLEGEDAENLLCVEEVKTFEVQIHDAHGAQGVTPVTEEWGDCETYFNLVGTEKKTFADCYRAVCKNTDTGERTQRPGRMAGKAVAGDPAGKNLQDENGEVRLPPGTKNPTVLPVALSPVHIGLGENVAQRALEFNGGITAPAIKDISTAELAPALLELIRSGGANEAFERKGDRGALGSFIVLDLGSPIGINRIRFYPRNTVQSAPQFPFQNDFLRQFELLVHAGQNLVRDSFGNFSPRLDDYVPLLVDTANEEPVVDIEVRPPRLVRYVRIKAISSFPYELDEVEVYGQGFMASSRYLSPIYDLGGVATWGNVSWIERPAPPGRRVSTDITVRTRTGNDPTTLVYKRQSVQRASAPQRSTSLQNPGEPLGRDEYLGLKTEWTQGAIEEDSQNWSPWSAPYVGGAEPGGAPMLSPGPRRYVQFSIEFQNNRIDATSMIEQLAIEYLLPPIADDLIAEIFPREVELFEPVQFTYAVRALMDIEGVVGFDAFQIETPTRILGIDQIQILNEDGSMENAQDLDADIVLDNEGNAAVALEDGSIHALPYVIVSAAADTFGIISVTDRNFQVRFPHISRPAGGGGKTLKILFRNRVLIYGTLYRGEGIFSSEEGSIQRITPGNAAELGEGDLPASSGITVLSPSSIRRDLIGSFTASPNPFTPNGDRINDVLGIEYDLLSMTSMVHITLRVFDLSGRLVHRLHEGKGLSGHYDRSVVSELGWDGRDEFGALVPPGIYLLRFTVEGDAKQSERTRPVAVAY